MAVNAPSLKWMGPVNCAEVYRMIGWEHSFSCLNHSEITGLGPKRDETAYWGDVIGWKDGHWCVLRGRAGD